MQGMELWRPDWFKLMKGSVFNHMQANELVTVTHETARLALGVLKAQNERDYYHNYGAAADELREVLK